MAAARSGWAIFATPRTGSSLLVSLYKQRHPELNDLDEFFYVNFLRSSRIRNNDWYEFRRRFPDARDAYYLKTYESRGGAIERRFQPLDEAFCADADRRIQAARGGEERIWVRSFERPVPELLSPDAIAGLERSERRRRLDLLRAHAGRPHVLKIMPQDIDDEVIDYLGAADFAVVCLARRDVLQQVLSFLIARHTRVMNLEAGDDSLRPAPADGQFQFAEADLDTLFSIDKSSIRDSICGWYEMLPKFGRREIVYYEDLVRSSERQRFIKVLPEVDYLRYFRNQNDVLRWYDRFAQELAGLVDPGEAVVELKV